MEKEQQAKQSPLSQQPKKRMKFDDEKSKFRATTIEMDGKSVRTLKGYPLLFDIPGRPWRGSKWVEKIDKKALDGVDFSKLVLLFDHSTTWILGRVGKNMKAVVDDIGLFVEVTLGNTQFDDYVFDRVQNEIVDGMSFWFDNNAMIASDWENKIDVILKINEIYEVSIVVFPAYEETVIITEQTEPQTPIVPDTSNDEALKQALIKIINQL